ncbi:MAG: zinc ribbon domain-containing protein, partial [Clostridia bacterium]|nr:zinc ribbon domain-containing protein [Clostridia bacterium]
MGFCIPLVGLILFLVWKDTKPKSAKSAGIGALVSVGVGLLFYILMVVAGV